MPAPLPQTRASKFHMQATGRCKGKVVLFLLLVSGCSHPRPSAGTISLQSSQPHSASRVSALPPAQPTQIPLAVYKREAGEHPSSAAAQYRYARALVKNGSVSQGVRLLEKAARLNPQYAPALDALANYYKIIARPDLEVAVLQRLASLPQSSAVHLLRLADIYLQLQWVEAAQPLLQKAAAIKPGSQKLAQLQALTFYYENKNRQAVKTLQTALAQHPGSPALVTQLAQYLTVINHNADAISLLRSALNSRPQNPSITLLLCYYLLQLQQPAANAEALQRLQALKAANVHSAALYCRLGAAYQASGNISAAIAAYTKAADKDPGYEDTLLALGRLLARSPATSAKGVQLVKQYEKAQKNGLAYGKALETMRQHQNSAAPHLQMAAWYKRLDELPLAALEYQRALAIQPGNSAARHSLQQLMHRMGELHP